MMSRNYVTCELDRIRHETMNAYKYLKAIMISYLIDIKKKTYIRRNRESLYIR